MEMKILNVKWIKDSLRWRITVELNLLTFEVTFNFCEVGQGG